MIVCVYRYVCVCVYICVYICICIYECVCIYMCIYMCVCIYVYACVCVCMCVYMCICINIYIYVCVCLCVYMYIYISIYCMPQNRACGTIQHIDPYLYQNRICRLQIAPSENTYTYIQTNSSDTYKSHLPLPVVSRDVPLPASTHRFTLILEENLHVTNCFLSYI